MRDFILLCLLTLKALKNKKTAYFGYVIQTTFILQIFVFLKKTRRTHCVHATQNTAQRGAPLSA